MTIAQTLKDAGAALSASSDSPQLDAEILLSYILKQSRAYLRAHPEVVLTDTELHAFATAFPRDFHGAEIAAGMQTEGFNAGRGTEKESRLVKPTCGDEDGGRTEVDQCFK